jgi:hypothetical protein
VNTLVSLLNERLLKFGYGLTVKKETNTMLRCYIFDLNDYVKIGGVQDYKDCLKMDVDYKKEEIVKMRENFTLWDFVKREIKNYEMAKKLGMLRR